MAIQEADISSYGIGLAQLPETTTALETVLSQDMPTDPPANAMALQASAEWYRQGLGPLPEREAQPVDETTETLAAKLERVGPQAPPWLASYMGGIPSESVLGWNTLADGSAREWSHSRFFEFLCNNLYAFFVRRILRLDPNEEVRDALDATDIGTAVHKAFELNEQDLEWRVEDSARLQEARDQAQTVLAKTASEEIMAACDATFEPSPAVREAAQGIAARWSEHFGQRDADGRIVSGHVTSRILPVDPDLLRMAAICIKSWANADF